MKKWNILAAVLCGTILLNSNFVYAQEIIDVSVQGISNEVKDSKRQDRDEAIMDAKLQAIEKAGVNIKSITEVENFVLKYDMVESKAEAYLLPGFRIIDVGYGADGLYHVVLTGKVRSVSAPSEIDGINAVKIGDQIWATENLNVSTFRNGDPIPQVSSLEKWQEAYYNHKPAWCYYNNDRSMGKKYGKLYNWYAVNDPRGLGSQGWHVPTRDEFFDLYDYLDDTYASNGSSHVLKSSSGWVDGSSGSNLSGFSALPGGIRGVGGQFEDLGQEAYFWSSTSTGNPNGNGFAFIISHVHNDENFGQGWLSPNEGLSVRLIRN